jgi:predicted Zn finger-like uncharacterized protein
MRLVCPNCDAEYEVDASVIPDNGRDVQCSNCGHAWFQLPPAVEAEIEAEAALYEAPPALAASPLVQEEPEPTPVEHLDEHLAESEVPRRSIDESVLAVLREEAEREAEVRKSETPPVIETQTEMGLDTAKAAPGGAMARRIAKLKGEPEPIPPQTRREMLPEIEELNSTLRSSSEKRPGAAAAVTDTIDAVPVKRSGFRSGFTLMILIAAVLTTVYLMAPKLSVQFPAMASALTAYVATIDQLRVGLDGLMKSAIAFLQGLVGNKG